MDGEFVLRIDCTRPVFHPEVPGGWRQPLSEILLHLSVAIQQRGKTADVVRGPDGKSVLGQWLLDTEPRHDPPAAA